MNPVKIGLVGCGAISPAYLGMAKKFPNIQIVACADIIHERAEAKATEFGVPKACPVKELMADPKIEIVLNLTPPKVHHTISMQAIASSKHAYSEKPLGINRDEGRKLLDAAKARHLLVGCAPDTILGAGIQTARKLLDDGAIGRPIGFTAFMLSRGPENWHHDPEFFYQMGSGPMMDMGPYYVTALLNLLGPVRRLTGLSGIEIPDRTVGSKPKLGTKIVVETPDHIAGTIEFANGAIGTIMTSFATMHGDYTRSHPIAIFGTRGTLRVPDPNVFDGTVQIRREGDKEWQELPHTFVKGYGRAVGLADMACAIRSGRAFRCNGQQAFAVLDIMQALIESGSTQRAYQPAAEYQRPAPMRPDLPFGVLDE